MWRRWTAPKSHSSACAAVADALAREMDGVVTDDQGAALSPEAMTVIAAELEQLYDMLEQRELAAGSPLARRLFS